VRRVASISDTQTERLVFALRERILRGEFHGGERLTELGLVSLLQASRTPVRLALERLAHDGLVDPASSGGFRVRSFTVAEIWDAIEIRGVLEGTAARFAAERLESPGELATLRALAEDPTGTLPMTVERFALYQDLNSRFHRELWRLSKSNPLVRALETASKVPFAAPGASVFTEADADQRGWPGVLATEHHRGIVEAIQNREGTRAEALAREHSRVARRNLECALQNKNLIGKLPGATLIDTNRKTTKEQI
jgi:GntR family transcriptional regulator of vanillate catabolism